MSLCDVFQNINHDNYLHYLDIKKYHIFIRLDLQ